MSKCDTYAHIYASHEYNNTVLSQVSAHPPIFSLVSVSAHPHFSRLRLSTHPRFFTTVSLPAYVRFSFIWADVYSAPLSVIPGC